MFIFCLLYIWKFWTLELDGEQALCSQHSEWGASMQIISVDFKFLEKFRFFATS